MKSYDKENAYPPLGTGKGHESTLPIKVSLHLES